MRRTDKTLAAWVIAVMFLALVASSPFMWASTVTPDRIPRTTTVEMYTISACLDQIDKLISVERWTSTPGTTEDDFLRLIYPSIKYDLGKIPELKSLAAREATTLNTFLAKEGFPGLQLSEFPPDGAGAAAVLNLLIEWAETGTKTTVYDYNSEKEYPAVRMGHYGAEVLYPHGDPNQRLKKDKYLVKISTKSQDVAYMATLEDPDNPPADLLAFAQEKENLCDTQSKRYSDGVIFPMVNLDHRVDISWVKGLQGIAKDGSPVIITEAIQQTRLKINELGARVESASAMVTAKGGGGPEIFVIKDSFIFWIRRPGLKYPIIVAYLRPDCWKNPGKL